LLKTIINPKINGDLALRAVISGDGNLIFQSREKQRMAKKLSSQWYAN